MALNSTGTDACGLLDQSIPQWKRELIIRRRALGRTLQVGSSSVKLTCPAVVAVVRQPEIVSDSDNVNTEKQKVFTSEVSSSSFSSLNQNPSDFHPSTSSAFSVSNMRFLNACSDENNLSMNGIEVTNKQSGIVSSDLCVNYNLVMGEDKSPNIKKKSAAFRSKVDQNNISVSKQKKFLIDRVLSEGSNGRPTKDEDCPSDSSEELQYGPGIVNKLKTKYLSMTLREQKRNLRPSIMNLRRAASLENMLEGDGNSNIKHQSVVTNTQSQSTINNKIVSKPLGINSHHTMKHLGNRSLETMKRARSMDTLLKSDSRNTSKTKYAFDRQNTLNDELSINHKNLIASIVNENIIIVENSSTKLSDNETSEREDSCLKDSPKHLITDVSLPVDKEFPPPDLVRQKLKIFETSPKKTIKPQTQTNLAKLFVGLSNTTSQHTARSIDRAKNSQNKPMLSPKPVLSPEKIRQNRSRVSSPKKSLVNANNSSSLKVNNHYMKQQLQLDIRDPTSNTNILKHDKMVGITSPTVTSPRSVSPIVTVVPVSKNDQKSSKVNMLSQNSSQLLPKTVEKPNFASKVVEIEETDSKECSKSVPESALENIRRGGVSMQFTFNNENSQCAAVKSYLPRSKSPPQALNTSLLKQKLERSSPTANISAVRLQSSPHNKQVGIIRPLVNTKLQSSHPPSVLTEQEIEKNLINRVKSIEQPISKVVVAIKAVPDNVVLGSVSADLVSNKNLSIPHMCANPIKKTEGLWDKKVWHPYQNTIVFNFSDRKEVPDYIENDGLIFRGKRDRPKPGEGGFILLDGTGDESSTDAEESLTSDPPSPCDVTFENDNVLINGRSNLQKSPKQVKLRIKFNDEATTMFEYPSEASLVEEDQPDAGSETAVATSPTGLPLSLGGSLGAYTPRQTGAGDWQLGMTPLQHPPSSPATITAPQPAPAEATVVWSEDTASDLLF